MVEGPTSGQPTAPLPHRDTTGAHRWPGLDVLRGLAALAVLVSHTAFVTGVVNPQRWASDLRLVLPRLDVGVSVFFVMSGALIAQPFVLAVADGRPGPTLGTFATRRLLRILPLYWAVLGVVLAVGPDPVPPAGELLTHLTLTHIYRPSTAIGPITQSWSLATELAFYAFVPLWAFGCRRALDRRGVDAPTARLRFLGLSLIGWVVVALVWRVLVIAVTDTYDYTRPELVDVRGALLTWLPNHLDTFAVGVALCIWVELRRAGQFTEQRTGQRIGQHNGHSNPAWVRPACYAGAAVALWVASTALDLPPLHTGFDGPQTMARHLLFVAAAALVVAPTVLARPSGSSVRYVRIARVVGLGSYGIYLWHQFVTDRWFARPGHPVFNTPFPTTTAVVVVVSAALAWCTYHLVERWPTPMVAAVRLAEPRPRRAIGPVPALDGLRGLAIIAVLGTHIIFLDPEGEPWLLRGGFLGVDVFLVLSGFLISATLLRERDRTGSIDLAGFVRRRARRLVPALVVFWLLHAAVVAVLGDSLREELLQATLALTFVGNWQLSAGHQPPFDLVHLWSLSVEAQLYAICALAMVAAQRRLDRVGEVVGALCAAIATVAIWRTINWRWGVDLEALYERTDVRADSLAIGALAAVLWRSSVIPEPVARKAGIAGAAVIMASWWWFEPGDPVLFAGGFTAIAIAAAAVISAALVESRSAVATVAAWAPLRWLGEISYSLYLWHLPIYLWTARALPEAGPALTFPIAVCVSLAVATLSHRFVESPFLRARRAAQADRTAK